MIVVDTSAIVSVYLLEPDADAIRRCIVDAKEVAMSAGTVVEASIVLGGDRLRSTPAEPEWLDEFMLAESVIVLPVTIQQAQLARSAFRRYGKGTGHKAQLNFGDCFSYALAKELDVPLLYKGNDFAKTDIISALV